MLFSLSSTFSNFFSAIPRDVEDAVPYQCCVPPTGDRGRSPLQNPRISAYALSRTQPTASRLFSPAGRRVFSCRGRAPARPAKYRKRQKTRRDARGRIPYKRCVPPTGDRGRSPLQSDAPYPCRGRCPHRPVCFPPPGDGCFIHNTKTFAFFLFLSYNNGMNIALTPLNQREILGYLGHQGQSLDPKTTQTLHEMQDTLLQIARPKAIVQPFLLTRERGELQLSDTQIFLHGADIRAHLADSTSCFLLAATLGTEVDTALRRLQVTDMAKALVFDAVATTAIEQVCDTLCNRLSDEGKMLTGRFSPGYGDMPLSQQRDFCAVLDTARKIGLSHTEHFLLTPQKSVTAIVGITQTALPTTNICNACSIFDTCTLRKAGKSCGIPR